MKIEGRYIFQLPIEEVYNALQNEELIRDALPGHVYFRMTSPRHYEAAMELELPKFSGQYSGELEVTETEAPRFYRLQASGTGLGRLVHAEGTVELTALSPGETEVYYLGDTDAFDSYNRLVRIAAAPIASRLANRGLSHLEQTIQARRASGIAASGSQDDAEQAG